VKLHYIEADALGTPRVIIDPVRDVAVWRWELSGEAFGDSAPNQDPDGDATTFVFDLRFPGQRPYGAMSRVAPAKRMPPNEARSPRIARASCF